MKTWLILILFFLNAQIITFGQVGNFIEADDSAPQINLHLTKEKIVLDGVLSEAAWQEAEVLKSFTQYFPTDSLAANGATEIYITYDENTFYVAAKCYTSANAFSVNSLKRDYGFGSNDNISFLFDTFNDKTNAFLFGMNPYGVRREALISNGGKRRNAFDPSWDNKWDGNAKMYDNYYICELAIPFNTIRYKEGTSKWRFNSYRNDVQCNEISCYMNIPRGFILMDLNYMAELNWEEPLRKQPKNISVIPYINTSVSRDYEDVLQEKANTKFSAGADAKISISSSLNLDLTLNPDFSQVEVDRQVTNLERFEIFFPERRQFFLENADLFSGFGNRRTNPFFSRRIGVSLDTITGNNVQNTIYGGIRLSGKLNEDLRIGLINMQAAAQRENDLPSFNYTVVAAEQQVFDRSNIGMILVNKQAFNTEGYGETSDNYDRIAGLEYRLRSKNNIWTGKTSFMQAFTPNATDLKLSHLTSIEYNKKKFRFEWTHLLIGDGFDAEVGFVPRKDILLFNPELEYRIFPKSDKIAQMNFSLDSRIIYKLGKDDNEFITDFGREETGLNFDWNTSFSNNHRFNVGISYSDFYLTSDFDPTRVQEEDIFFSGGTRHENIALALSYSADRRARFFYRINPIYERFFGGDRYGFSSSLAYRWQPYANISFDLNYSYIDLGGKFETAELWLVGPRIDITFSKKLFWTTFIQYNNQLQNLNINSRFQWRFAPVSDFFIVYTDNYNTESSANLLSRNRALIAKLTYWLNT